MNRFANIFKPLTWLMAILLAAFVAGCGGGGGDGGSSAAPPPPAAAPIGDIAGVWTITETAMSASDPACQPPGNPLAIYQVTVTQPGSGNDLTVLDAANPSAPTTFPGTLKGDQLTWTGSFPERGGVTTWTAVNATVAADCNTATGTSTWTYVGDAPAVFSCTGTTTFTGTANVADGCTLPPASAS